jgi:tetratricopeptide (TPR) repeat protein
MPEVARGTVRATAFLVASITFIVYLPALNNDFLTWDDYLYVYENQGIRSIDFGFLKWTFTAVVAGNWHPLTMFTHALDYALWGLDPWGHHLTSIIFHTFNTFLVFILVVRLSNYRRAGKKGLSSDLAGADRRALIAGTVTALVFGIHPVHVESVAWISERKDVMSAFFFLLSVLTYLKYTSSRDSKRSIFYGACLVLFIMALMSKPMAVTLPVVLLILDYYPLGRLSLEGGLKGARWLLLEKVPFFVLSLLSSLITIWAQHTGGALQTLEVYSIMVRTLVAVRAYAFYIYKMVLPVNLAPYYPYPVPIEVFAIEYIISFILLTMVTSFCIWSVKRDGLFLSIWFYYLVTLIPVIGIVQVGGQAAADRYTYLPSLGPFLLAGLGAGAAFERYSKKLYRTAIIATLVILSGFMANKTVKQIAIWQDSIGLWLYEIDQVHYNEPVPHNNLGVAYHKHGQIDKAIEEYKEALRINPDYPVPHYNLGIAFYEQGQIDEAIRAYRKALNLKPDYLEARLNLGFLYGTQRRIDEAIDEYREAIGFEPGSIEAHYNLGILYRMQGRIDEAIAQFQIALRLKPDYVEARFNLGRAYREKGLKTDAIREFEEALRIKPDFEKARKALQSLSK